MSIEAIGAIGSEMIAPMQTEPVRTAPAGFGDWFAKGLDQVNAQLVRSETDVQALATGQAGNLHEVMIHLEEAKLSFELLAQIRNRLLESYQEVMRMQV